MASHTNPDDNLTTTAVRLARAHPLQRAAMRDLINHLSRTANPPDQPDDPAIPPKAFTDALRKPKTSRRKPVSVLADGMPISVLLNPQGKADPKREAELWAYVRNVATELAA